MSSVSVFPLGNAFARCAAWLDDAPAIGVGVHLAAVGEDPPLLEASEIPTLVDRRGHLAPTWRSFLRRAAEGRIDRDDLRREFAAQIEAAVAAIKVRPTHLDTHQHLHLWPLVGDVVVEFAVRFEIPAIRVPRSRRRTPRGLVISALARRLAGRARRAGLRFPADAAGLDEAGRMDATLLETTIRRLAARGAATAELVVHPGTDPDPDRARYAHGYRWGEELSALSDPAAQSWVRRAGFRLGSYASL